MKITYLVVLLLLCGTVSVGCLNMGAEKQVSPPSELDYSRTGYEQGSGMVPAPNTASLNTGSDGTVIDQKLIKTGSISLEVTAVPATIDRLNEIAVRNGGYLSSSSQSGSASDHISATVVVRVPAAAFEGTVSEIKALGTVRSASVNTQDITEEYVDLQAQKEALQRQLDQYSRIMEKAEP